MGPSWQGPTGGKGLGELHHLGLPLDQAVLDRRVEPRPDVQPLQVQVLQHALHLSRHATRRLLTSRSHRFLRFNIGGVATLLGWNIPVSTRTADTIDIPWRTRATTAQDRLQRLSGSPCDSPVCTHHHEGYGKSRPLRYLNKPIRIKEYGCDAEGVAAERQVMWLTCICAR